MKYKMNMTKSVALALIVAWVVSLCGCLRLGVGAVVSEDGTVDVTILYAGVSVDDEDMTSMDFLTDEQKQELESQGWTCEDYFGEDGDIQDYTGYLLTKKDVALSNWNEELSNDLLPTASLTCRQEGDLYIIEWPIGSSEEETSDIDMEVDALEMAGGYARFELELPHGAIKENASSKDGNKYTWSLMNMKESVYVSFTLDGSVPQGVILDPTDPSAIDPAGDTTVPATESTTIETNTETTTETTVEMPTEETTVAPAIETTTEEPAETTRVSKDTKPDKTQEEPSETTKKNKGSKERDENEEKSESSKTFPIGVLLGILGGIIVVAVVAILIVILTGKKK